MDDIKLADVNHHKTLGNMMTPDAKEPKKMKWMQPVTKVQRPTARSLVLTFA
jgi:hypothetical protein